MTRKPTVLTGLQHVLALWPLLLLAGHWSAAAAPRPDLAALIECRQHVADFAQVFPYSQSPLKSVSLGWRPLPVKNPFMTEFTLLHPITIFGHPTQQIAFSGGSIMAILDLADPHPLAKQLQLNPAVDKADKVLFGRELVSRDTTDPSTGKPAIESIVLNVSTVHSHPGKTLVGCNYSLDEPD